jgi:hypothetical protein
LEGDMRATSRGPRTTQGPLSIWQPHQQMAASGPHAFAGMPQAQRLSNLSSRVALAELPQDPTTLLSEQRGSAASLRTLEQRPLET